VKNLFVALTFFYLTTTAYAGDLPFNIIRDENNRLVKILISHKTKHLNSDVFVNELKHSIAQISKSLPTNQIEIEGYTKLSKEEQEVYLDSIELLKQKSILASLEDKNVKFELDKINQ
jgi:hypothetical protein